MALGTVPQDPNVIAMAILAIGGAMTTVVGAGLVKIVRGIAQWQREQIEAMAGVQLTDLVHVKRMHEECERRGVDLERRVGELKASVSEQDVRHSAQMADMLNRNTEIERNMTGLCFDLLRASGHMK